MDMNKSEAPSQELEALFVKLGVDEASDTQFVSFSELQWRVFNEYMKIELDDDARTVAQFYHFPPGTTEANLLDWIDQLQAVEPMLIAPVR